MGHDHSLTMFIGGLLSITHGEKRRRPQTIRTSQRVWWKGLRAFTKSDKILGGVSSVVGMLDEGTIDSSQEDQERLYGGGIFKMSLEV